jgi:hypothetical protein
MSLEKPSSVKRIGDHTLEFEPPDICVVRLGDTVTEADCEATKEELLRLIKKHGAIFQLIDYSRARTVTPEARKMSAAATVVPGLLGAVGFGISFQVRVLATLTLKLRTLANRELPIDFRMVADEAEARALIAERRRELKEKQG